MEELLEQVTELSEKTFKAYINTVEHVPEKISKPLYAAYQNLDIARAELTKFKRSKEAENK